MFRRVRQLRISLATKCQLLFGAAVILIVSAALFVPWRRIEQLTEQHDERPADAVAEYAIAEHVRSGTLPFSRTLQPESSATTLPSAAARPSSADAAHQQQPTTVVRLVPLDAGRDVAAPASD